MFLGARRGRTGLLLGARRGRTASDGLLLGAVEEGLGCSLGARRGRTPSQVLAQTFVWLFPAAITFAMAPSPAVAVVWTALLALGLALIGISPFIV